MLKQLKREKHLFDKIVSMVMLIITEMEGGEGSPELRANPAAASNPDNAEPRFVNIYTTDGCFT